jgi:hypothetical protein
MKILLFGLISPNLVPADVALRVFGFANLPAVANSGRIRKRV